MLGLWSRSCSLTLLAGAMATSTSALSQNRLRTAVIYSLFLFFTRNIHNAQNANKKVRTETIHMTRYAARERRRLVAHAPECASMLARLRVRVNIQILSSSRPPKLCTHMRDPSMLPMLPQASHGQTSGPEFEIGK